MSEIFEVLGGDGSEKVAVLFHSDADGFGAAFAAWYGLWVMASPDKARPAMKFIPVQYSQEPPVEELYDFAPNQVLIVDFSYKRDVLLALKGQFPSLIVIDHHKTAKEELDGLDFCVFDMNHSGCALTWQLLVPEHPLPAILGYVEDRDLWKFDLPESKAINAYIATLPWEFEAWLNFSLEIARAAGNAVLAFQEKQVKGRMKDVSEIYYVADGMKGPTLTSAAPFGCTVTIIPCVNASENISEVGEAMCEACPDALFSMSYCDRADGQRSYSLRSNRGFDVSVVAKAYGGGGHPGAAGFTLPAGKVL